MTRTTPARTFRIVPYTTDPAVRAEMHRIASSPRIVDALWDLANEVIPGVRYAVLTNDAGGRVIFRAADDGTDLENPVQVRIRIFGTQAIVERITFAQLEG